MKKVMTMEALECFLPGAGIPVFAKGTSIEELQDRLTVLLTECDTIQAGADAEKRDLTDEERTVLAAKLAEFEKVEEDIKLRQSIEDKAVALTRPNRPRAEQPAGGGEGSIVGIDMRVGTAGFKSMGDFLVAVRNAGAEGGKVDDRLIKDAASATGSEGTGTEGGYAVPPDYRTEINQLIEDEESLLGMTDQQTSSSNSMVFPVDETTPWGASGITAEWEGESPSSTPKKPDLKERMIRLNKLKVLVAMTDELLNDAPSMERYLRSKAPAAIIYKMNDAFIRGTGAGMPQGILNSGSLVTVAKESSQAADTILAENIDKMWGRCYAPSRRRAVWFINQDAEPQLNSMVRVVKNVAGTENVGGAPAYMPPGGLSNAPYGTLLGRPVIPIESCSTIGDVGDIMLADMMQYMTAVKQGGIRQDMSIHLWFDADQVAFRFILRVAGQSWWNSAVTPAQGSNTRSPFVALAARA